MLWLQIVFYGHKGIYIANLNVRQSGVLADRHPKFAILNVMKVSDVKITLLNNYFFFVFDLIILSFNINYKM